MYTKKVVWKINETLTCLQKKNHLNSSGERETLKEKREVRGGKMLITIYGLWLF